MEPEKRVQNAFDEVLKACGQSFHSFNLLNEADIVSNALDTMRRIMTTEYKAGFNDCHAGFVIDRNKALKLGDGDPLHDIALLFVRSMEKFITADLQREFNIGYSRARRIIDTMTERGEARVVNDRHNSTVYWVADIKVDA